MSTEIRNTIEDIQEEIKDSNEKSDGKRKIFECELCGIKVTSINVLRRHKEGRKHTIRAEREGKSFECNLCEIVANSQSQLDAHLKSSRHRNRLYKTEHARDTINYKGLFIVFFCIACLFSMLLLMFKK